MDLLKHCYEIWSSKVRVISKILNLKERWKKRQLSTAHTVRSICILSCIVTWECSPMLSVVKNVRCIPNIRLILLDCVVWLYKCKNVIASGRKESLLWSWQKNQWVHYSSCFLVTLILIPLEAGTGGLTFPRWPFKKSSTTFACPQIQRFLWCLRGMGTQTKILLVLYLSQNY